MPTTFRNPEGERVFQNEILLQFISWRSKSLFSSIHEFPAVKLNRFSTWRGSFSMQAGEGGGPRGVGGEVAMSDCCPIVQLPALPFTWPQVPLITITICLCVRLLLFALTYNVLTQMHTILSAPIHANILDTFWFNITCKILLYRKLGIWIPVNSSSSVIVEYIQSYVVVKCSFLVWDDLGYIIGLRKNKYRLENEVRAEAPLKFIF